MGEWKNKLHYGDNLEVLRKMDAQSVDLFYLDPPFNSARNYNLLFKQHKGQDGPALIAAGVASSKSNVFLAHLHVLTNSPSATKDQ